MPEDKEEIKGDTPEGEQTKPEEPKKPVIEEKAEKPKLEEKKPAERIKAANCAKCEKPLKRRMWYYRNGKFYCNKRCWKKSIEKVA